MNEDSSDHTRKPNIRRAMMTGALGTVVGYLGRDSEIASLQAQRGKDIDTARQEGIKEGIRIGSEAARVTIQEEVANAYRRGYDQGKNESAETTPTYPDPGLKEYIPPFQETRQYVKLDDSKFKLSYELRPETLREDLLRDLKKLNALIEANTDNPDINPDISHLQWIRDVGDFYSEFRPPTLLNMMKLLERNIEGNWVTLGTIDPDQKNRPLAQISTGFKINNEDIHIGQSHIAFDPKWFAGPDRDAPPLSNLNMLVTLAYEYSNRLCTTANFIYLRLNGFFDENKPKNEGELWNMVMGFAAERKKRGNFQSKEQNVFQFTLHRSIATLAGDPNGIVEGLEYNESLQQYKNFIAALNGDPKAQHQLDLLLNYNVGY